MRIYIFRRHDSKYYHMKWTDSAGVEHRESTRCKRKSDAKEVVAVKRQKLDYRTELAEYGLEAFRERYELEYLAGKSKVHRSKFRNAFNKLAKLKSPAMIGDITGPMIAELAAEMRVEGLREATIDSYLGYIQRALSWAVKVDLLSKAPIIERPKLADESCAKGRPLTLEEVERLGMQAETVVGSAAVESFEFLLKGLRLSGLRLGEALRLWWRDGDKNKLTVQIGAYVTLVIPASGQKRRRREIYPVAPEFAQFLLAVPLCARKGPVFNPLNRSGSRFERVDSVSKRIAEMGRKAGIVTNRDDTTGELVYASAQDLRRTFGLKWAKLVRSVELKALMRHRDIKTTEKYYAIEDANAAAASLQARFGAECSIVKEQVDQNA